MLHIFFCYICCQASQQNSWMINKRLDRANFALMYNRVFVILKF
uniref:Uncharacterized protein n=1 Tax=Arundo donax TaxID=35708 RepID=A0A0A9CAD4_ARUDO